MKMKHLLSSVLGSFLLTLNLSGHVIVHHFGANDPATEGFSLSSIRDSQKLDPVFSDQGKDAWSIHDTGVTGSTFYQHELTPQQETNALEFGWILSGTFRFVEPGVARLSFRTADVGFTLGIRLDTEGNILIDQHQNVIFALAGGGTAYHEYALIYDPIEEVASLWVDGSLRVEDLEWLGTAIPMGILFGNWSSTHTHWHETRFEIIPEPSTVALLCGIGALLFAVAFRRRKRQQFATVQGSLIRSRI